ncbi:MAG: GSCFA domain-containing protein [Cytophagaceae bacterium]
MFRTELRIAKSPIQLDHNSGIITIGSCFSNVIGKKLEYLKFNVSINPFGIIYNPVSIFSILEKSIENTQPPDESFLERDGIWYNFDLHSEISGTSKDEVLKTYNQRSQTLRKELSDADILTITLGTSFIYKRKANMLPVANCHKIPATEFVKHLLAPEEIIQAFRQSYELIKKLNPGIKIIFTLSPVRHIKDSIPLNSVSKSILRYAIHKITETFSACEYFPSYELMIDDLRDYRFYGKDMIHPSEVAEEYIWEKFSESYFPEETRKINKEWKKTLKAIHHKPFHPSSENHHRFVKETIEKVKGFEKIFNVEKELQILQSKL